MEVLNASSLTGCWKEQIVVTWKLSRTTREWEYMSNEFKEAINGALKTAKPKGTRHQGRIERARLARETFSEVTETEALKDLVTSLQLIWLVTVE